MFFCFLKSCKVAYWWDTLKNWNKTINIYTLAWSFRLNHPPSNSNLLLLLFNFLAETKEQYHQTGLLKVNVTKSSPRRHFPPLQATLSVHRGTNGEWRPLWSDVGWEFDSMVSLFVSAVCLLFPQPSECEQCTCDSDGIARCLVADCAPPPCVNPVYQPGKCCPECQDGTWQITSGAFCNEQCGQPSRVQSTWGRKSPLTKVGLVAPPYWAWSPRGHQFFFFL